MRLVDGIHYRAVTAGVGDCVLDDGQFGFVCDIFDGKLIILFRTDPDVRLADIQEMGRTLRRERLAANAKRRRLAKNRRIK